ncbi:hypothetical protein LUD75_06830 [Epilithonimonas sp. JDS]|uniref:hypothetical protein n=1 Tax=Epilithonimonas sp. JDS TaxID=2902797 RepID=UPI001E329678|nr:hypothetical protein [Epilithonimonas sp. JDS]MCD9854412.1 hypothetical protein [Epilithonimonas sp. JDS]
MILHQKLKILKFINVLLMIVVIPLLLIYVLLIIPEYSACSDTMFEGEKGIDFWGDEIDCNAESQAFSEALFQMFSVIIIIIVSFLILINLFYFSLKKGLLQSGS